VNDKIPTANSQNKTILLFGEILADIFPDRYVLGGAPFNVAHHLQEFGLHPVLISRTGSDALQQEILSRMTEGGMDTRGLQTDSVHPTGQVLIHVDNGGHRFEIVAEQAYDFIEAEPACETVRLTHPDLIYFGTLAQRHPVSQRALGSLLENCSAKRLLDINLRPPWFDKRILEQSLTYADYLKLNIDELYDLGRLLQISATEEKLLAATLIKEFQLEYILVTNGNTGAWLQKADGDHIVAAAGKSVKVVDTVGAGDGFSAVFILGLFCNWPMEQTLRRADAFAREICKIRGAIPAGDNFYQPFRTAWNLTKGDF
jgi:fructokinase